LLYFIYGLAQFVETPDVTTAAPKITGIIVNGALCVMCYGLCRDRFRLTRVAALGGAMSCAIVINVIPNMQSLMNVFLLLAIYESWDLLTPSARVSRGQCLLCGIAWAGAYWANYTGFIIAGLFVVGVAAWLVYARIDRRIRPLAFRPLVIAGVVGTVLVSVHMIRNWLVAGNPIYPAMFGVIGGRGVSPWYLEHFTYTKTIDPRWHEIYVSYLLSMPQSTLLVAGAALALLMHRPSISTAWRAVFVVMFAGYYVVWVTLLQVFTAAIFRYPYALVGPASAIVVAQLQSAARRTTWARLLGVVALIAITATSLPKLSIGSALTPDTIAIIKARAIGFYVVVGLIVVAWALSLRRWAKVDRRFNRRWVGALVGVVFVSFLVLTEWRRDLVNGGSLRGQTTPIHYAVIGVWLAVLCVVFFLQRSTSRLPARWATVMAIVFFCGTLMVGFQPRQFNLAKLPVDTDIAWINRFVPAGSVLLTLETRLYFLEHGFFPADHHELEPFYRAQDARTARDELKKLGVTHIYYNSNTTTSDLFNTQIRLLMSGQQSLPGTDGEMLDVIYSNNKTDWVAVLR
jgi:hypothetical protein